MDNFQTYQPQLRADISFGPAERQRGKVVYYVGDRYTNQFYRIGAKEYFLLSRMDGQTTLAQLAQDYTAAFGRHLDQRGWENLFKLLDARQMLTGYTDPKRLDALKEKAERKKKEGQGALLKRYRLVNPDRLLEWLLPYVKFVFSPRFVIPAAVAIIIVEMLVLLNIKTIAHDALWLGQHAQMWPLVFLLLTVCAAIHETAHGLACKRYGGKVNDMGVMWRYFWFYPYCKLDYIVLFHNRWHRVYVALAGPFANLLMLTMFGLIWWQSSVGGFWHGVSSRMLLVYNFFTFLNFVPFVQLDGYFMLCHALGLSELRKESHAYVRQTLQRKLFNWDEGEIVGYSRSEKRLFLIYGICSIVMTIALLGLMITFWYNRMSKRMGSGQATLVVLLILFGLLMRWKGRALWVRLRGRERAPNTDQAPAISKT